MQATPEHLVRAILHAVGSVSGDRAWCAAPQLWVTLQRDLPAHRVRAGRVVSGVTRSRWRWRLQWWLRDRVLYVTETLNQRRNLLPVCSDEPIEVRRERVGRFRSGLVAAARAERDLRRLIDDGPALSGAQLAQVHLLLTESEVYLRLMDRLLRRTAPELVAVASQNQPSLRAVVSRARDRAIPTLYIPHAPVADDPIYADIPYSLAALRGQGEVARYQELGADASRLLVVGNPSLELPDDAGVVAHPPILAVSPWEKHDVGLAEVVRIVREATDEPVWVAPHPLSNLSEIRAAIPAHWTMFGGGRTFDLIRQVDAPVLQVSSGVGLEALLIGRRVVQLEFPGMDRLYPYLCEPHVACVSSAAELRQVLAEPDNLQRRQGRREWARHWCSAVGREAVANARDVLRIARESDPNGVALDGWLARPVRQQGAVPEVNRGR